MKFRVQNFFWRCKFFDKSHVCTSIKSFLSVFYASYTSLLHLLQLVPKSQTFSLGSLVTQPEHHCCHFLALCVNFSDLKISTAMPKKGKQRNGVSSYCKCWCPRLSLVLSWLFVSNFLFLGLCSFPGVQKELRGPV